MGDAPGVPRSVRCRLRPSPLRRSARALEASPRGWRGLVEGAWSEPAESAARLLGYHGGRERERLGREAGLTGYPGTRVVTGYPVDSKYGGASVPRRTWSNVAAGYSASDSDRHLQPRLAAAADDPSHCRPAAAAGTCRSVSVSVTSPRPRPAIELPRPPPGGGRAPVPAAPSGACWRCLLPAGVAWAPPGACCSRVDPRPSQPPPHAPVDTVSGVSTSRITRA